MTFLTYIMFIYGVVSVIMLFVAYFLHESKTKVAGIVGGAGFLLSFVVSILSVVNFLSLL